MSDSRFARTLREAAELAPVGPGRYEVNLSRYFSVFDRPNGGYLQCVIANAALAVAHEGRSTHRHALAVSTNYVGSARGGTLTVEADLRRAGKGVSFAHVVLREGEQVTTESIVTLGTLHDEAEPRYLDATSIDLPPREACIGRMVVEGSSDVNFGHSVDFRYDPACMGWTRGEVTDRAELRGWLRLNDGEARWDAWSLLFASDASPPATFPVGSVGWVPTLQLTSYVRSVPVGEWLSVRQWCVVIQGDLADERCEIFDERGRLVASASQLVMCRFPPTS